MGDDNVINFPRVGHNPPPPPPPAPSPDAAPAAPAVNSPTVPPETLNRLTGPYNEPAQLPVRTPPSQALTEPPADTGTPPQMTRQDLPSVFAANAAMASMHLLEWIKAKADIRKADRDQRTPGTQEDQSKQNKMGALGGQQKGFGSTGVGPQKGAQTTVKEVLKDVSKNSSVSNRDTGKVSSKDASKNASTTAKDSSKSQSAKDNSKNSSTTAKDSSKASSAKDNSKAASSTAKDRSKASDSKSANTSKTSAKDAAKAASDKIRSVDKDKSRDKDRDRSRDKDRASGQSVRDRDKSRDKARDTGSPKDGKGSHGRTGQDKTHGTRGGHEKPSKRPWDKPGDTARDTSGTRPTSDFFKKKDNGGTRPGTGGQDKRRTGSGHADPRDTGRPWESRTSRDKPSGRDKPPSGKGDRGRRDDAPRDKPSGDVPLGDTVYTVTRDDRPKRPKEDKVPSQIQASKPALGASSGTQSPGSGNAQPKGPEKDTAAPSRPTRGEGELTHEILLEGLRGDTYAMSGVASNASVIARNANRLVGWLEQAMNELQSAHNLKGKRFIAAFANVQEAAGLLAKQAEQSAEAAYLASEGFALTEKKFHQQYQGLIDQVIDAGLNESSSRIHHGGK